MFRKSVHHDCHLCMSARVLYAVCYVCICSVCGVVWCCGVFGAMYMLAMVCSLSVRMAVKCGICGVLDAEVSFDSSIVMTSGCVVRMRYLSSSTVLLMPFSLS